MKAALAHARVVVARGPMKACEQREGERGRRGRGLDHCFNSLLEERIAFLPHNLSTRMTRSWERPAVRNDRAIATWIGLPWIYAERRGGRGRDLKLAQNYAKRRMARQAGLVSHVRWLLDLTMGRWHLRCDAISLSCSTTCGRAQRRDHRSVVSRLGLRIELTEFAITSFALAHTGEHHRACAAHPVADRRLVQRTHASPTRFVCRDDSR